MGSVPVNAELLAPPSDDELVARILAGDTAGFELLMRRHNQRLYRIARAIVRTADEAEEVVQDAYVRGFVNLGRFEGRASVATWLSRITLHEALRARRRWRRDHAGGTVDIDRLDAQKGSGAPAGPIERAEMRTVLVAAMDALPTRLRAVLMLRLVEGLDTRETAQSLGMTEENVRICLHRGRRLMCESIQRETIAGLREQFSFAADRCDRIVAGVFRRLELHSADAPSSP